MDSLFLLFMARNMIQHLIGMMRRGSFKTPRPMHHILTWTSMWVFLWIFCLEKCCFMLHWKFDDETLSFCCVFVGVWVLYNWSYWKVGFRAFLKCCIFWSWCNLDNVGGLWNFDNVGRLWCCWMNLGLDFGSIGIMKNLCYGLVWICSWCMWEILLACVSFVSWTWKNFVGMENICGHEILTMEKIVGHVIFDHEKFYG